MNHRTISVALGGRSYPVYLGAHSLKTLGAHCVQHGIPSRVVVIADRNSARAALKVATSSLEGAGFHASAIIMPPGERQKSFSRAEAIHSAMLKMQIPRNAAVIALGGGVVGDVAGFVASTYRRGLPFVQCPTTLLSQVDSSVGGKNGVNHPLSKNAVGTFHQPLFVFSDVELLRTLPRREVIAGIGEILKYPIVSDPELLTYLETNVDGLLRLERETVLEVASRCLHIKATLVGEDEKELLSDRGRVFLNVGHAVGHALETLSHYMLRHGEAVLLGIIAETYIAVRREGFPESDFRRIVDFYHRLGCRYSIKKMRTTAIVNATLGKSGARFVLPRALGRICVVRDVTAEQLTEAISLIRSL